MATLVDLHRTKINVKRQTKFGSPKGQSQTKQFSKPKSMENAIQHCLWGEISPRREGTIIYEKEKWEGTTHPSSHPIMIDQIDSADPTSHISDSTGTTQYRQMKLKQLAIARKLIKDQTTATVAYVVWDEEIGAAIIMGKDSIITLQGTIMIDGDEQTNPLFPVPGDEKELYPKPVWATGLTVSLASPTYASKCETPIVPYEGPDRYFDCVTKTSFPITGKIIIPLDGNPDFCVLISKIPTPIMLGLDYIQCVDFQVKFPNMCISWPRTLAVRPYRPPARALAGPTCPRCRQAGHLRSQCTGRPRPAERSNKARAIDPRPQQ
ncbi:hypothetical protein DAPPUDRAFT_110314 [Daphnia pulex]|uniref:Uncharacterized protein n=1 Tax=Daphnia pulex TaxID=6669 RepID=E9H5X4_DAPPU|nr:hypothetical protein DAPPUDRAFT_110314 [Daphnia pulex]|eukprot:EFX72860.1 hypothetical protein DAPPUDRAFT_110314 [Daphnia pulex]